MKKSLWRGALAGLAGGIAASFAMNRVHALWTQLDAGEGASRSKEEQGGQIEKGRQQRQGTDRDEGSSTEKAAEALAEQFGVYLDDASRKRLGTVLHYAFGATLGAFYGAAVEVSPRVAAGAGVPFGAAVWLAADEVGMPAMGFARPPAQQPLEVHVQSLTDHAVYGAVTELVRCLFRGR
ncbi:MAG TPA: DUF1440 domain-containing protein [Thermoanaerobaculia bacterium]|nr:DUF1440 domain-containing protein [Thermoanaerobaculia bacterium]